MLMKEPIPMFII